jgi:lysophospholipase L1-like esterase
MFRILFSLSLLALVGCKKDQVTQAVEINQQRFTYLALGDSYTIGQSVAEELRWPNQLQDSLNRLNIQLFEPRIIARTGWRTDQLQAALDTVKKKDWDFVSLLIGVNDFYQNVPYQAFQPKFEQMLDSAIAYAAGDKSHVLVVSIPDYGFTPFGQSNQTQITAGLDQYNSTIETVCNMYGVAFISITDISQLGLQQPDLVASDGLHPSGKQYSLWAARIADLPFFNQYR